MKRIIDHVSRVLPSINVPWRTLLAYTQLVLILTTTARIVQMKMLESEKDVDKFSNSYCALAENRQACGLSPQFTKFLYFHIDGVSWDTAGAILDAFNTNTSNVYRIINNTPYIWSGTMFYTFMTGNNGNHMDGDIKVDSLAYQFASRGFKMRLNYRPGEGFVTQMIAHLAKRYPRNVFTDSRYTDTDCCSSKMFQPLFSCDQGDSATCAATVLDQAKAREESQFYESYLLDHRLHFGEYPNGRHEPAIVNLVNTLASDLVGVKSWIDQNPDYLLVLTSDHGHMDKEHRDLHGKTSQEGNQGWLILYNPQIQNSWNKSSPIERFDVCPMVAQYFTASGVSIPAMSIGSVRSEKLDLNYYKALRMNAIQLSRYYTETLGKQTVTKLLDSSDSKVASGDIEGAVNDLLKFVEADYKELSQTPSHTVYFIFLLLVFLANVIMLVQSPIANAAILAPNFPGSWKRKWFSTYACSVYAFAALCLLYMTLCEQSNIVMYMFYAFACLFWFLDREQSHDDTTRNVQSKAYSVLVSKDDIELQNVNAESTKQLSESSLKDSSDAAIPDMDDGSTKEISESSLSGSPYMVMPDLDDESFLMSAARHLVRPRPLTQRQAIAAFALCVFASFLIREMFANQPLGFLRFMEKVVFLIHRFVVQKIHWHLLGALVVFVIEFQTQTYNCNICSSKNQTIKKRLLLMLRLLKFGFYFTLLVFVSHAGIDKGVVSKELAFTIYSVCFAHVGILAMLPMLYQREMILPIFTLLNMLYSLDERFYLNALVVELYFLSSCFQKGFKNCFKSMPYILLMMNIIANFNYNLAGQTITPDVTMFVPGIDDVMLYPRFSVFIMVLHKLGYFLVMIPYMIVLIARKEHDGDDSSFGELWNCMWYIFGLFGSLASGWFVEVFSITRNVEQSEAYFFWAITIVLPISIFGVLNIIDKIRNRIIYIINTKRSYKNL